MSTLHQKPLGHVIAPISHETRCIAPTSVYGGMIQYELIELDVIQVELDPHDINTITSDFFFLIPMRIFVALSFQRS